MANFKEAFAKTMIIEGGYSNDPQDLGGETYKGISRVYNPSWKGWKIIDSIEDKSKLDENIKLQELVRDFYKDKYWDKFLGDYIPSQDIAEELFDTSVNLGVHRASKYLQEALNILNRNGKLYKDIVVDGFIGRKTLDALHSYLEHDPDKYILLIMNILQGMHYINYMRKSPTQEKFARGWLKRVEIIKEKK